MKRKDAAGLGWIFVADQEGYVRAEKILPNGDLIEFQGETEQLVVAAIESWENYPVQAPNTRTNDLGPDSTSVSPPAEPVLDDRVDEPEPAPADPPVEGEVSA